MFHLNSVSTCLTINPIVHIMLFRYKHILYLSAANAKRQPREIQKSPNDDDDDQREKSHSYRLGSVRGVDFKPVSSPVFNSHI